jgi:Na+/H+ antiporter NhaD/arsenite permease-like protein
LGAGAGASDRFGDHVGVVAGLPGVVGPGLLLTGSIATVICRRIARDAGATQRAWQYSATGAVLAPAQIAAAVIGLHLTSALH